jgi:hypothetical protein
MKTNVLVTRIENCCVAVIVSDAAATVCSSLNSFTAIVESYLKVAKM